MVTIDDLRTHSIFYHSVLRNKDSTALRCRANGKLKLWKTRPHDFQLPVKYGLRQCFYITSANAAEWCVSDPTDILASSAQESHMTELDAMLAEIDENHEDWNLRLIAADLAEDMGAVYVAQGLRWQAEHEKRPLGSTGRHLWYDAAQSATDVDVQSDIPTELYQRLIGWTNEITKRSKVYPTMRAAEAALWRALAETSEQDTRMHCSHMVEYVRDRYPFLQEVGLERVAGIGPRNSV